MTLLDKPWLFVLAAGVLGGAMRDSRARARVSRLVTDKVFPNIAAAEGGFTRARG